MTGVPTSIGVPIAVFSSLPANGATLITNGCFSELTLRLTKLKVWINIIAILYEETLKKSMLYEKVDEKERKERKKI